MAEHEHGHDHAHEAAPTAPAHGEVCPDCGARGHGHSHHVAAKPVVTGAAIALVALVLVTAALAGVALFLRGRGARRACPACGRFVSPKAGTCPLCGGAMEDASGAARPREE